MNLSAINRAIEALCSEGTLASVPQLEWTMRTEDDLFFDVAVCILSSQSLFELALAAADGLRRVGLLAASSYGKWRPRYEEALSIALARPVTLEREGSTKSVKPRFRNRAAKLIAATAHRIYGAGSTLRGILASAGSAAEARRSLVAMVSGFGPKQASLYLRRIGYCADFAVLDTHILDYLSLAANIEAKPGVLSRLSTYEKVERDFERVARSFGYPLGCVDLATWVTMRVAKRGSFA